jgi:hypothetical protein
MLLEFLRRLKNRSKSKKRFYQGDIKAKIDSSKNQRLMK